MCLYGFTSTSRHRNIAESFSFENAEAGMRRVLIRIFWEGKTDHYYMNQGSFEHEEEILLMDGLNYAVVSI